MKKTATIIVVVCLLLVVSALTLSGTADDSYRLLRYGAKGEDVTRLQERLTELGYYTFRITGNYQERTQAAVKAFQKKNGFRETGEATPELQELIFSESALPKITPTPVIDLLSPYGGNVLEYGNEGEDVRRIQTRLAELGYYQIEISGKYLGNTRNAVKSFQTMNGLKVTGKVDAETWELLFFGGSDTLSADASPRPTPTPTPVPYRVEVDVTNQVTTVFSLDQDGNYTNLIRQMICSTGTEKDPSPLGVFVLNGRTARWCFFDKWGTHAQYWTRITSSIAFHSVIYNDVDEMALNTSSYRHLGERTSHGCIRLLVDDARWIYLNCGKGTEVEIYEGIADPELTESLKPAPLDRSIMLPSTTPQPEVYPEYNPDQLPPLPFETLEKGSVGFEVYWLQCRLAELGYYHGSITGGYYDGTKAAVKAFQEDNGLRADGKAGKETLNAIYAEVLNQATEEPAPDPTPSPVVSISPSPNPSPSALPTTSGSGGN